MKLKTLSLAVLTAISLAGPASAAIVIAGGNGDFESTTIANQTFIAAGLYQGGLTTLDGWTFSGGTNSTYRWLFIDTDPGPGASNPYGPMLGTYSLNLTQANANFANVATTSVTGLVGGGTYTLSFDTAVRSGGGGTITVKVDGSTVGTFDGSVGTSYVTQSYSFTAAGPSATVAFEYGTTVNNNGYMLDNVTVIPEPSAALLGGLGLLALLRRRR
jgi:hypothetical protein